MITDDHGVVMLVDDDLDLLKANAQTMELMGWTVRTFQAADAALATVDDGFPGVIVSDVRMPGMDGHQFYRRIRAIDPDLPVILITGHGDIAEAVRAMKDGAYDFIAKPYPSDHLSAVVRRALDKRRLVIENRRLKAMAEPGQSDMSIIGDSPATQALRARIRQLAAADIDVLIEGETGVGKELVARALHREGPRRQKPFVVIDCAALDASAVESDLFGHELGAFSGAVRKRIGRIESADQGTLFLDEVEALSIPMQGKLLRLLEEREITAVGAAESRPVSLRIIASVKSGLAARVAAGEFRPDLYYRLDVGRLSVPPLRDRMKDIPALFVHFLAEASETFRRPTPQLGPAVQSRLFAGDWPGNVRELRNFAIRVLLGVDEDLLAPTDAPQGLAAKIEAYERHLIHEALTVNVGDVRKTTAMLQTPRKTFYEKARRHGIDIDSFRRRDGRT